MGAMGDAMQQNEECCKRKEFKKSLGGFDGWRMEGLARRG
jgi:hypothetical protein